MMPEPNDPNQPIINQIQDKRQKPPGILPKNTQAWVLSGIALLMVGVIALSGKNPPKARVDPPPQQPLDPNAARIQEYQKRIEEQARRLQAEQAQLVRAQQALGVSPNVPAGAVPSYPASYPGARSWEPRYTPESTPAEDPIQTDKKKREYQSLFASNIALSYRNEVVAQESLPPASAATMAKALALYGFPNHVTADPPASSSSQGPRRSDSATML